MSHLALVRRGLPLLACALGLSACVSTCNPSTPEPSAPPRRAARAELPPPSGAVLRVPIALPLEPLRQALDATIPDVIVGDTTEKLGEGVAAEVLVKRSGPVQLAEGPEHTLRFVLPLAMTAKAAGTEATVEAEVELQVDLTLHVGPNWLLAPEAVASHRWVEAPTIAVGPFQFDLTRAVDARLEPLLPEIAARATGRIQEANPLPATLAAVWGQLATPRPLAQPEGGWVHPQPETAFATRPEVRDDALHLVAGVTGPVLLGEGALPETTPPPLPSPSPVPASSRDEFKVVSDVDLPWAELSETFTAAFADAHWPVPLDGAPESAVVVRSIELYPTDRQVALSVVVGFQGADGRADATHWLTALPAPDARRGTLRFKDVAAVEVQDAPVDPDSDAGRVRKLLETKLRGALTVPLDERMQAALAAARDQLAEVPLDDGGALLVQLSQAELKEAFVTDEALRVRVELAGHAEVELAAFAE